MTTIDPNEYHYVMTISWSTEIPDLDTGEPIGLQWHQATDASTYHVDPGDTADYIFDQILDCMRRVHRLGDAEATVVSWTLMRNQGLYQG